MKVPIIALAILAAVGSAVAASPQDVTPAPIQTPWDAQVNPDKVWPEYPRPQLVREQWLNLNGRWDWAITKKHAPQPKQWSGKILVPFCFEADLRSGTQIDA